VEVRSLRLPGDLEKFKPALVVVVVCADNDFGVLIRNRIYSGRMTQTPECGLS
jgi:hypothetical protein